ncbi:homoserine kinase [Psittacicella hinzii]|uniref:Homoserine kinase n=1 Tax=Psittacicella hinzii TaxID=2028575 RepID=A0A3A1YSG5_9GAMM|nr:homoserine kinase [Psittacicella hinzii]RIY39860.1 homoserine kinase [Psittacicella hinzii]
MSQYQQPQQHQLAIFAPATSANLSVGFDLLGLALSPVSGQLLGDVVAVDAYHEQAGLTNLAAQGEPALAFQGKGLFIHKLSPDLKKNLVIKAYDLFKQALEQQGKSVKPLTLTLYKAMPVGSGLGSSSASVVATLVALNQYHDYPLSQNQMLLFMGQLEGSVSGSAHYDNVAPSYLGGLQLMFPASYARYSQAEPSPVKTLGNSEQPQLTLSLPLDNAFGELYFVLAYPGTVVRTEDARKILPDHYSRAQIIQQTALMGNFVSALYSNDLALAVGCLHDVVAEPYRETLLPNHQVLRQALYQAGALACGISGSGPTFYALASDQDTAEQLVTTFKQVYLQNEQGFVHICKVDKRGARALSMEELTAFIATQQDAHA